VDLDDRVVDVDHHPLAVGCGGDQRSVCGQPGHETGGDVIELADVAEGERSQERPQRRGRVGVDEEPTHPAVTKQRHVIDAVRTRDQRGHLQARVRALVRWHAQVLVSELLQTCGSGQRDDREQAGRRHEVRIIEDRRGRTGRVAKLVG